MPPSTPDPCPPLNEEQLALMEEHMARAVKKGVADGVRRYRRQALVGFAVLFVGLGAQYATGAHDASESRKADVVAASKAREATVASGRAVAVDSCNRDFRTQDDFRGLLIRLRVANDASFKAGRVSAADHRAAVAFYDTSIAAQQYPNCAHARSIITDNPNKTIVVPRPLSTKDAANFDVPAAISRISKGG